MAADEAFVALLDRIARQPKGIVIFLVREDAWTPISPPMTLPGRTTPGPENYR